MRPSTIEDRRRVYLLARVVIARHYNRPLTLDAVAKALACSPRQLTRAFAQFGNVTFREELLTRRLTVAAQMLVERPTLPVREVARAVGYRQAPHFAQTFRGRYGLTPARFRASEHAAGQAHQALTQPARSPAGADTSACRPPRRAGR